MTEPGRTPIEQIIARQKARFLMMVRGLTPTQSGCLEWPLFRHRNGYGSFMVGSRVSGKQRISAHRLAWETQRGCIPSGLFVCHHCDNKICVNVDHLFLGTNRDNVNDSRRKGRWTVGSRNGRAILNEESVRRIRRMLAKGISQHDIAVQFGVAPCTVGHIAAGNRWRHVV
jgi:HNH endonuclease